MELPEEYNNLDEHEKKVIFHALSVILEKEEYIKFVIDKDNSLQNTGFMFSESPLIYEIGNRLLDDGHSGSSFAITLRNCQNILRQKYNINKFEH